MGFLDNTTGATKMLVIAAGIALLVSTIAVIVACVAISNSKNQAIITNPVPVRQSSQSNQANAGRNLLQYNMQGSQAGGAARPSSNRIWTVAYGHDYGAHEYLDERGYLSGFSKDIVQAACAAANMDCRIIWEPYINCMDSSAGQHSKGGKGLLGGWYDACTTWSKTVTRTQIFKFSQAYLQPVPGIFYRKKGSSFSYTNDLSNLKLGFFDGWANDEKCLARAAEAGGDKKITYTPPTGDDIKTKIRHYLTVPEITQALKSGEVDAVFAGDLDMNPLDDQVEKVTGYSFMCLLDGHGMMTRKDNDFVNYFNVGLNKIIESGKFRQICADVTKMHGKYGTVRCKQG